MKILMLVLATLLTLSLPAPAAVVEDDATETTASTPQKPPCREKGNNGLGNGYDPQPPGNPPINDGPGTSPGNPGNRQHGRPDGPGDHDRQVHHEADDDPVV